MKILIILFVFGVLYGCSGSTELKLSTENTESEAVRAKLVIVDKNSRETTKPIGDIQGNGKLEHTFEIENENSYYITATDLDYNLIFKGDKKYVDGNTDPLIDNEIIKSTYKRLDDLQSFNILSESFKKLGNDIGALSTTLDYALDNVIGALVVAVPSSSESKTIAEIIGIALTPNQLGVRSMTIGEIRYPDNIESQSIDIKGSSAANLNVNALFAKFGLSFAENNIYKLNWKLRGFSIINKSEDNDIKNSVWVKVNSLPEDVKKGITELLASRSNAKLFYINSFYILREAEIDVFTAKKIIGNSKAEVVDGIVTADGLYSFENSEANHKNFSNTVLNYYGIPVNVSLKIVTENTASKIADDINKSSVSPEVKNKIIEDLELPEKNEEKEIIVLTPDSETKVPIVPSN